MFGQAIQFQGDSLEASKLSFKNYTGSQLIPGQVYALDLTATNAATVAVRDRISNLVGVVAANLQGILIVAEQATAPLDFGLGVIMGLVAAFVNGGATSAVSEVQTLTVGGTVSAGSYRIQFQKADGSQVETNNLAFNASLSTINTALDAVSGGAGLVVASGTALTPMAVTFSGAGYTGIKQPLFTIDANDLTGATTISVVRTTEGIGANNGGGQPGTRLKAVAGQTYLTACDPGTGNTDQAVAVQLDKTFGQISAPGAPTLAAVLSGGALAGSQTIYVKYAWQGAGGLTTGGTEQSQVLAASALAINSVTVTTATAPTGATSAVIYASNASGQELLVGAVAAVTGVASVFTITQLPPASAPAPSATNTTGTQLCTVFFCGLAFMGSPANPALT